MAEALLFDPIRRYHLRRWSAHARDVDASARIVDATVGEAEIR